MSKLGGMAVLVVAFLGWLLPLPGLGQESNPRRAGYGVAFEL